jgi:hypothetical protein
MASGSDVYRKRWEALGKIIDGMEDRVKGKFLRALMREIETDIR